MHRGLPSEEEEKVDAEEEDDLEEDVAADRASLAFNNPSSSPLLKQAKQDVQNLNTEVYRTNTLCADSQKKYHFCWGEPFLVLILTTALSGAFVALLLFPLQPSLVCP